MVRAIDSHQKYLAEIAQYPRISPERERELSTIVRCSRDESEVEAAVQELVHSNLKLVPHCARRFESYLSSRDARISRMDLVGEGNVALLRAARSFDAGYTGGKRKGRALFAPYACRCIRRAMLRAVKLSRLIHVPEYHFKHWRRLRELQEAHGEGASDELLSSELDVNPEVLDMLRCSRSTTMSMLDDLGSSPDGSKWEDWMADERAPLPDREADARDLRRFLMEEMSGLPSRTRRMLCMVFMDERRATLAELAEVFGISAERCRQVCGQGLTRLRRQLEGRLHQVDPTMVDAIAGAAA